VRALETALGEAQQEAQARREGEAAARHEAAEHAARARRHAARATRAAARLEAAEGARAAAEEGLRAAEGVGAIGAGGSAEREQHVRSQLAGIARTPLPPPSPPLSY
jgi:hypothetical protein